MKPAKLFAALAAVALFAAAPSLAQQSETTAPAKQEYKKQDGEKKMKDAKDTAKEAAKTEAVAKVGSQAPDFTLTDTDGKEVKLSSFAGKIVVLEWFNPECPFVVKHHSKNKTFADMAAKYTPQGVVFLAINSGAPGREGHGKDKNANLKKEWNISYPVLLDETGIVGRMYGAKRTPHMYVINKDGILAYTGAIDNDNSTTKAGAVNYVANALDELIAGKPVTTKETEAYGCSVKYGKKN